MKGAEKIPLGMVVAGISAGLTGGAIIVGLLVLVGIL